MRLSFLKSPHANGAATALGDCFPLPSATSTDGNPDADDALLNRYIETNSGDAFSQIVYRHSGWVYHLCRRNLRDAHLAEDATQAVFLLLSRKALSIKSGAHLAGWLFQATRYVLADLRKNQTRYRRRQELARQITLRRFSADVQGDGSPDGELSTSLDEAICGLRDSDRQTILMHFYEGLSLDQMAGQLRLSREGAKKRVSRALSRLREQFAARIKATGNDKRSVPLLVGFLLLLRARGAEAAPLDLVSAVTRATTVPGQSSLLAEMIATGVRQAAVRATDKLLATLVGTAVPLMLLAVVSLPLIRQRSIAGVSPGAWSPPGVVVTRTPSGGGSSIATNSPPTAALPGPVSSDDVLSKWDAGSTQPYPSPDPAPLKPADVATEQPVKIDSIAQEAQEPPAANPSRSVVAALGGGGGAAAQVPTPPARPPDPSRTARPIITIAAAGGLPIIAAPSKPTANESVTANPPPDSPPPKGDPHPSRPPSPPKEEDHNKPWSGDFAVRPPPPWWNQWPIPGMDLPPGLARTEVVAFAVGLPLRRAGVESLNRLDIPPDATGVESAGLAIASLMRGPGRAEPVSLDKFLVVLGDGHWLPESMPHVQRLAFHQSIEGVGPDPHWDLPRNLSDATDGGVGLLHLPELMPPSLGDSGLPPKEPMFFHRFAAAPLFTGNTMAVPEPTASVVMLLAGGLLGLRRRRTCRR